MVILLNNGSGELGANAGLALFRDGDDGDGVLHGSRIYRWKGDIYKGPLGAALLASEASKPALKLAVATPIVKDKANNPRSASAFPGQVSGGKNRLQAPGAESPTTLLAEGDAGFAVIEEERHDAPGMGTVAGPMRELYTMKKRGLGSPASRVHIWSQMPISTEPT